MSITTEADTDERISNPTESPEVAEIASRYNAYFLHGIPLGDRHVAGNSLLMAEHSGFKTKVEVCLAFDPVLSVSTISRGQQGENLWAETGLLVAGGEIKAASKRDMGTVAQNINERRSSGGSFNQNSDVRKDIQEAVVRSRESDSERIQYNELVVGRPEFAGIYWRRAESVQDSPTEGNTSDLSRIPKELIDARDTFGLPLYVLDNGELRQVTALELDRTYTLGEPIAPGDVQPEDTSIDTDVLRVDLLEKGVFQKLASKERNLIANGEEGRFAYLLQHPERLTDSERIKMSWPNGLSCLVKLAIDECVTYDMTNIGQSQDNPTREHGLLSELRFQPFTGPNMGFDDRRTDEADKLIFGQKRQYLEAASTFIHMALDRITEIRQDDKLRNTLRGERVTEESLGDYLQNVAAGLYGFAEEAERYGDKQSCESAIKMAEELMPKSFFDELRAQRRTPDGDFRLLPTDLV